ncbi:predicted protein [Histoplasma capsulatum H143]|uniref:Uncharacterized protein n=1 Tax=Ajellomyces capsulatus (strain H143) TaxID=544712 RepID=C6H8S6_AJECH|nr:predicted protein [Histoplasma capsulatum H143]
MLVLPWAQLVFHCFLVTTKSDDRTQRMQHVDVQIHDAMTMTAFERCQGDNSQVDRVHPVWIRTQMGCLRAQEYGRSDRDTRALANCLDEASEFEKWNILSEREGHSQRMLVLEPWGQQGTKKFPMDPFQKNE